MSSQSIDSWSRRLEKLVWRPRKRSYSLKTSFCRLRTLSVGFSLVPWVPWVPRRSSISSFPLASACLSASRVNRRYERVEYIRILCANTCRWRWRFAQRQTTPYYDSRDHWDRLINDVDNCDNQCMTHGFGCQTNASVAAVLVPMARATEESPW